jgi:pSer/pThr/pTyr-binding forkhead associated (FHA) protein
MLEKLAPPKKNLLACLVDVSRGKIHVLEGDEIVIGRSSSADIQVRRDGTLSRRHAVITLLNGEFFVQDLDSKNGTVLNSQRVRGGRMKLKPDDKLTIGKTVYFFSPIGISEALYGSERKHLGWYSRLQLRMKALHQITLEKIACCGFGWLIKPARSNSYRKEALHDEKDAITEPISYIEVNDDLSARHRV